jgi:hypothetical protein
MLSSVLRGGITHRKEEKGKETRTGREGVGSIDRIWKREQEDKTPRVECIKNKFLNICFYS